MKQTHSTYIVWLTVVFFYHIFSFFFSSKHYSQEGYNDPPSVSSINRLIRGTDRQDDGRKDYSIHGILGGKSSNESHFSITFSLFPPHTHRQRVFFCSFSLLVCVIKKNLSSCILFSNSEPNTKSKVIHDWIKFRSCILIRFYTWTKMRSNSHTIATAQHQQKRVMLVTLMVWKIGKLREFRGGKRGSFISIPCLMTFTPATHICMDVSALFNAN